MIIGVDIDDVLGETNIAFDDFHNKKYGTNFKKEDHFTFNLDEVWDLPREEMVKRLRAFFSEGHYINISPVLGSEKALRELSKKHEIKIITARMEDFKNQTLEWLNKHYGEITLEVHHANHYYGLNNETKSDICVRLGVEMLIDDCLEFSLECAEKEIKVLLLDNPWNQMDNLPKNVTRVSDWNNIITHIKALNN
ncbi:MAG: hypothetical protein M1324_03895 [Patescibacteria group bacterium]|nr:hypothetical protein [Patescibacteria group bacterium]